MPTCSRESMKKNPFKNHHQEKMFDELTHGTINNIYNQLLTNSENKETSMLILDDVGASLKDPSIATILRKIIFNRRHLKVHIIVMLQSYMSFAKEIRKLFSNIIIFKPSKTEFENLMNEMFEMHKEKALNLLQYIFTDPHDYLFLNVDSQKMYKNFDEIIIPDK
jgi:ASC-1-like (ASCH) protein